MHIRIGRVKSLSCENWQIMPNDRQQAVEVIGGIAIQDFGRCEAGDKFSCTAVFMARDWEIVKHYWESRELVDLKDGSGKIWQDIRVIVKSYGYCDRFPSYCKAALEFWRA